MNPLAPVINVRGTNGSGKTTAVRQLMERQGSASPILDAKRKIAGYQVGPSLRVIGTYDRPCGGAESLRQAEIRQRVRDYAEHGAVIFEGLLVSTIYQPYADLAQSLGRSRFIFAFLIPPLEVCIERVKARRVKNGTTRPFDPSNVAAKWHLAARHVVQFSNDGFRVVELPWADPVPALEELAGLRDPQGRRVPELMPDKPSNSDPLDYPCPLWAGPMFVGVARDYADLSRLMDWANLAEEEGGPTDAERSGAENPPDAPGQYPKEGAA